MNSLQSKIPLASILLFLALFGQAQAQDRLPFLQPADTLNKVRFWATAGTGAVIYSGVSIGLYEAWYKNYELTGFRTFDDYGEWENIDKMGHAFTAYLETRLAYNGARWTGMNRKAALWTGAGIGLFLQSTVEVMDGFSAKWGFSWSDTGFNLLGIGVFVGQELLWQEQRIYFKVSSTRPSYSNAPIASTNGKGFSSTQIRADDLYGTSFAETFLKDYNGQTNWVSFNIYSFLKDREKSNFPKWLNIAVGYGAENLFGGYGNTWTEDEFTYALPEDQYPRYRQYYLSLDIDLSRIETKSRFWNTLLDTINFIKIPAPTLEYNSLGDFKFHAIYW